MGFTDRYILPLLDAAQAHKEIEHNEALLRIDALVHVSVISLTVVLPPTNPTLGDSYIIPIGANGAWAQHPNEIATSQAGGWTYLKPIAGCIVWSQAANAQTLFDGVRWRTDAWPTRRIEIDGKTIIGGRQPAIGSPTGGSVIDLEARIAIGQLLTMLRVHGLIEA